MALKLTELQEEHNVQVAAMQAEQQAEVAAVQAKAHAQAMHESAMREIESQAAAVVGRRPSNFSGVGEELGYLLQRSVINASSPHYTNRIFTSTSLEPTV